jgi:hypothetical protein
MKLAMVDCIHHSHANDQLHDALHGEMLAAPYADRAARIERTHADATVGSAC